MNVQMQTSSPTNGINLVEIAERFGQYFIENIDAISIVVVVLIGALVYQQIMHMHNETDGSGVVANPKTSRTVIVEPFDNADSADANDAMDSLDAKLKAGFCKTNLGKPAELEQECGKLSKDSCTSTSCCVWAKMDSKESCVSGNQHGPIFKNEKNGSPKTLDYYYFENKCSGNCPDNQ
uniref:Uncharacterized protein n=1 Tax=viral metagenome TaxID=1070528 RepID=A0A6C0I4N1_9ZZZZ